MSIQSTIEAAASTLPPSLARIAAVVRENPSIVIDKTINELAEECHTSVASVVRFCRAIGFSGYAPLRMALATELGKEAAQFSARGAYGSEISDEDSLQEAVSKLAALELLAIEETVARLDFDVLEAAIDAIDGADRILLYGIGASQFVAEDLAHKLLRVGRNAHVLSDSHEAVAASVLQSAPTVAIGFSHAGSTIETVRFLETARANGSATVAVTSAKDSPRPRRRPRPVHRSARIGVPRRRHGQPHRTARPRGLPVHRRREAAVRRDGRRPAAHPPGDQRAPGLRRARPAHASACAPIDPAVRRNTMIQLKMSTAAMSSTAVRL
ncbi:MurR/RpiR family transcriptional regulator [Microbacterium sp. Se63.02b]|uniref:MurR/RpiR family transcriptional regulator n=1 Tax=Microbacterium sp. Se63.02b TaxID=2709304 RepID=UPI001FCF141C|nr:MurR/RpiR family transcriptional regulator [Microbacterium sp. Se63.02b]